jgi:hypothetical protein
VAPMMKTFFLAPTPSISVCVRREAAKARRDRQRLRARSVGRATTEGAQQRRRTYEDLVEDTVASTAGVAAATAATGLGNRVELVKEHDARRGGPRLVKDVADVGLRLSEPHRQELGALAERRNGISIWKGERAAERRPSSDAP